MKEDTPAFTASANGLERSASSSFWTFGNMIALPSIYLVHRLVINVRGAGLSYVETVINGFGRLSEVLLLVSDEMFCACLHTGALNATDRVGKQFTSKVRVRTKTLPVTTSLGRLWICDVSA